MLALMGVFLRVRSPAFVEDLPIDEEEWMKRNYDPEYIVEIYNQAVLLRGATADLTPLSVESRKSWFHDHTPESRPIWVMQESTCG